MTLDVGPMLASSLADVGLCQLSPVGAHHLFLSGELIDLFPDWPGERLQLYGLYTPCRKHSVKVQAFVTVVEVLMSEEKKEACSS